MKGKEGEGLKISCDVVCFQGEQEFSFITSSNRCIISRKGQGMIVCHTDTTRLQDLLSVVEHLFPIFCYIVICIFIDLLFNASLHLP